MEIIIGKNAGLCSVAQRAIDKLLEETKNGNVYCLGEIVHNRNVIDSLKKAGVCFINNIDESKGTTIIGAHGVTKDIYDKTDKMNKEVIDLTCPVIIKIKKMAEEYSKKGYFIIIVGKSNHTEVLGIKSIVGSEFTNIQNKYEIPDVIKIISNKKRVLVISQTTFNSNIFDEIIEELKKTIKSDVILEINKTICLTTLDRQKETKEMAKSVDVMIIVGDKNSSNTTELYNIAHKYCENTQFICCLEELNFNLLRKSYKIGIMGGASTPKEDILKVKNELLTSDRIKQ